MDAAGEVIEAIRNNDKIVVAQVAPALRVTIGEEFGCPAGTILTRKLVGALKAAGFDRVFDTSTAADVVTVEEGTEFIDRLRTGETLPLFTSCCPASVSFIENNYPRYLDHFCTVKSPQQTMGALIKTYYARKMNMDRKKIFVVSIMPCVVKRLEAKRPEMEFDGIPHVDAVITTVEAADMLKRLGINPANSVESGFDELLGVASGAGQLFGATGGVAEAMLRFVSAAQNEKHKRVEFRELRGKKGFREATISVGKRQLKIGVAHGLINLKDLISDEKRFSKYHILEIMVCPYGCIGGGGQPPSTEETKEMRRQALIKVDSGEKVRISFDNPEVRKLYEDYLLEPGSKAAHSILHTQRVCLKCD
jgi:iron-only hydrogenase group A